MESLAHTLEFLLQRYHFCFRLAWFWHGAVPDGFRPAGVSGI
jgi:hypothetical protein